MKTVINKMEWVNKIINSNEKLHNIFQPILRVDQKMNATVNTYEMLMRDSSGAFPGMDFLKSLTTEEGNATWAKVSERSLAAVLDDNPNKKIYINVEPCQLKFDIVWQFLTATREKYGDQVAVEITERRETIHDLEYLDSEIQRLKELGYELAIDDVCAGSNSYAFIVRQLKAIKRIKLSLLLFRNEDRETTRDFVNAWLTFATKHHLDFVIEGISDEHIAEEFAGNPTVLQQGYYWGKGSRQIS